MPTFVKPLVALLISILLFTGFIYLVNVELFDFVEAHFYNPSVINSYVKENAEDAQIVQTHINNLKSKFFATLTVPAIRGSFLYNQSPNDIFERSRIYGILVESTVGLQSVQFVDSNGIRLHYSTSARDIMSQNQNSTAYRNYNENPTSLPYEIVSVEDANNAKLTMDDQNDRIIFSFPFRDSMDVFRGTALFSVSISTFAERLIEAGRLKISDNISLINAPSGILLGSPETSKSAIFSRVAEIWKKGVQGYITLDAEDSGTAFSLISTKTDQNLFFGRLVNSSLFSISAPMKFILQVSIFLTFFLAFFFLLNLKPGHVTIVRNRITRLRESLFEQLYANKSVQERAKWILELEQRRDEIRSQLKSNLKFNKRSEENINSIIDKSLDEMLALLKVGSGQELAVVQQVKKEPAAQEAKKSEKTDEIEEIGEAEEIGEIGETEEIEKVGEVEKAEGIGEVEELEEIREAKEIGEKEEVGEVEELEEIGEAQEIGKVEDIGEAEGIEEIGEVEELSEIEELGDAGEIKEVTEAETIGEVETAAQAKEANIIDIALRVAMEPDDSQRGGLFWLASKFAKKKPAASAYEGLLKLASKKAAKKAASSGKGLLALASELEKPSPVQGKGLLALASELEKPSPVQGKGLLALANELEKPFPVQGKGLLALASELEKPSPVQVKGLLALANEIEKPASDQGNGLLTFASEIEKPPSSQGKGLLALASEIEKPAFIQGEGLLAYVSEVEKPVLIQGEEVLTLASEIETDDTDVQELIADMDIVSPFSSMFSGLSGNE
ncbi:hypothetical protein [Treponema sp. R80B11-R83G3]